MEEGFFVLKIKGLSIDGTIDPGCERFGYVAHIRKGMKGATENFFQWYKDTIETELCDNLRKKMGYNGGPIDKRFRIVLMKDGGILKPNQQCKKPVF